MIGDGAEDSGQTELDKTTVPRFINREINVVSGNNYVIRSRGHITN